MIRERSFKRWGWYEQYIKTLLPISQKTQNIKIMNLFPLMEAQEIAPSCQNQPQLWENIEFFTLNHIWTQMLTKISEKELLRLLSVCLKDSATKFIIYVVCFI